jgi:hypothetical protein
VQKAGLVEISEDDRALLYGAFLELAARLASDEGSQLKLLYRRRGARTFATEAEAAKLIRAGDTPI